MYRLTLQMGYIDRPVDWPQYIEHYALEIRAYADIFDIVMAI